MKKKVYFKQKTPWPHSASELYWPSDRHLSTKLVPTFANRGCHVVSVMHPYGSIPRFLDRIVLNKLLQNKRGMCSIHAWGVMLQARRLRVQVPIRSLNFLNVHNPSSRTMGLGFTQPLTEMSTRRYWHVSLTTLPPSVSQFSRQCGILNIWQCYEPPLPVAGIALPPFFFTIKHTYTAKKVCFSNFPCGGVRHSTR
jgi:hypothetical protein